ncbi:hypothetical protein B0H14DRAFT_3565960 [Mycena olivaceomarginata]|nr:hypothetical protein B0H14DRAFT_3565960 [Mycena olivaceomarginata]
MIEIDDPTVIRARQVHATGIAHQDLTIGGLGGRGSTLPRTGGIGAVQQQRRRSTTQRAHSSRPACAALHHTGTAGGGSRAVPAREDSLMVVIDTTSWGASSGDRRNRTTRHPIPAAHRLDSRPTAHAQRRIPHSLTHAAENAPAALHILSIPLVFVTHTELAKIESFEGGGEGWDPRGPDRAHLGGANWTRPLWRSIGAGGGPDRRHSGRQRWRRRPTTRRPRDRRRQLRRWTSCNRARGPSEVQSQRQPLSRHAVSRGAMSFTGGNAGAHVRGKKDRRVSRLRGRTKPLRSGTNTSSLLPRTSKIDTGDNFDSVLTLTKWSYLEVISPLIRTSIRSNRARTARADQETMMRRSFLLPTWQGIFFAPRGE